MTSAVAALLALAVQLADPTALATGDPTLHISIDARPQPAWEIIAQGPRWYRFAPVTARPQNAAPGGSLQADGQDFLYVERLSAIDLTYVVVHGAGVGPALWSAVVALSPAEFAPPTPGTIAASAVHAAVARTRAEDAAAGDSVPHAAADGALAPPAAEDATAPTDQAPAEAASDVPANGDGQRVAPASDVSQSASEDRIGGSEGFVYQATDDGITLGDPDAAVVLTLRYTPRRR